MKKTRIAALVIALLTCAAGCRLRTGGGTGEAKEEAQEEFQEEVLEEVDEGKKNDNTGTNPINFTYDARFYVETTWLDGGSLIAPTFEFRVPLGRDLANLTNQKAGIFNDLGEKYALRVKFRPQQNLNLDDPGGDPTAGVNISGMGDTDFRFLAVPYATNKWGIAAGLERSSPRPPTTFSAPASIPFVRRSSQGSSG